jgi:iron complex outermembrane receptor protein
MENLLQKLMLGGSTAALLATASMNGALAQGGDADIEQVVVSASRITIAGYTQPTPVTVIGAAQLESDAYVDLGDSIRQLPALGQSAAPDNGVNSGAAAQGYAGIDTVSLRNLGASRTLVLFDGQRVVGSDPQGTEVDLSTLPTAVVERVDVVTGGASAAWGSDAVAGVVNLIINKNYDGLKFNEEVGQNSAGTHLQFKSDATWGSDFLDGRGHFVLSGSYTMSPQAYFYVQAPWNNPVTLMPGPAGGPTYVHSTGPVGSSAYTAGGLITSGPFAGTQFVGPTGSQAPFNFGTQLGGLCENCSATPLTNDPLSLVSVPYHSTTLFGYAKYKLTDTIQASIQLNVGENEEQNINSDKRVILTIKSDNAYIPASIRAQMSSATGFSTLPVSTNNLEGCNVLTPSVEEYQSCMVADGGNYSNRLMLRGVFTLEGTLGNDWGWNAYVQHGQVREREKEPEDAVNTNYNNAVDAVTVTAANRGTSGLAIGNIVCRSSLTVPTNGCQPLDVFGTAPVPLTTLDYIDPGRVSPNAWDTGLWLMSQDVLAASAQGTVPWALPAGKIGTAFGAEYHHQLQRNISDPQQIGPSAGFSNGNFSQFAGQYNVYEGFAEVDVPVLKNNIVQSLDLNAAGRMTDYSTSGLVETWKLGLTSQIDDNIRVRTTWSTDIRAPSIYELFTPPQYNRGTAIDPKTGLSVGVYGANTGNPNLSPEVATTVSGGVVLTPQFIPGLSMSFDWYSIVVKGSIFAASTTQTLAECKAGVQLYCGEIFYGVQSAIPTNVPDYPGALTLILSAPLNASSQTTSGLDFQADYTMDLFTGHLNWHLVGNYTDEYSQTNLGVSYDAAGALSGSAPLNGDVKLHTTLAATYTDGPWSGTVQGRFLGEGSLVNGWVNGVNVDNNIVPSVAYLDLRGSYKWNDHIQPYFSISNVTNTPPPMIPSAIGGNGPNLAIYDGIGRMYNIGVRMNW